MARDYTVIRVDTDSSGRGIYMSRWMQECWEALLDDPRIEAFAHLVTIVQGPWMIKSGGGAQDSAGYHDRGGCIDIRTWNLTAGQVTDFVWVASEYGFQFWRRDERHGMDPHAHCVFGSDRDLTSGAIDQLNDLRANPRRNGLSGGGSDYEKRYTPIRLEPIPRLLKEDYMATSAAQKKLDAILEAVKAIDTDLDKLGDDERRRFKEEKNKATERYNRLVARIEGLADSVPADVRAKVIAALKDDA